MRFRSIRSLLVSGLTLNSEGLRDGGVEVLSYFCVVTPLFCAMEKKGAACFGRKEVRENEDKCNLNSNNKNIKVCQDLDSVDVGILAQIGRVEALIFWRGFLNCRALPPLRRALPNERSKLGTTAHARNATWCAEIRN